MRRFVLSILCVFLSGSNALAERTIHVFSVFCNAYPGEAGGINAGVSADQVIVNHIFTEYVSPVAWGVQVRMVEVTGQEATKAGIEGQWAAFSEGVGPDDTVYVHFSGHGVIRNQAAGEQLLQTCDLTEISRVEWAAAIESLPCRLKVFITDCCSSYPEEFVSALTEAGFLGALVPEEFAAVLAGDIALVPVHVRCFLFRHDTCSLL